jgi:hypothetical protein
MKTIKVTVGMDTFVILVTGLAEHVVAEET